jgi:hypothetical protein
MINKVYRPTSMGAALAMAAMKVDHQQPGNWVARRTLYNAEHTKLGVTADQSGNAKLKYSTAKKLEKAGIL